MTNIVPGALCCNGVLSVRLPLSSVGRSEGDFAVHIGVSGGKGGDDNTKLDLAFRQGCFDTRGASSGTATRERT